MTWQLCDGQQDTAAFFADDTGRWRDIAEYFANRIVSSFEARYGRDAG